VIFTEDVAAHCEQVLTVVPRVLGPRVGGAVQQVIQAVKAGRWSLVEGRPVAADVALEEGEYELRLVARASEGAAVAAALGEAGGVVLLDTEVTPELAAEGLARDVIRVVQQARREAGLDVSDRIALTVDAPDAVIDAVRTHQAFVAAETLATSVEVGAAGEGAFTGEAGDGEPVRVVVDRV
jgi:isoleucyl-tRNA synthetase